MRGHVLIYILFNLPIVYFLGMEETSLEQCMNVVSKLFRERNGGTDLLDLSSTDIKKELKEKKSPKPRRVSKRK